LTTILVEIRIQRVSLQEFLATMLVRFDAFVLLLQIWQ